MQQIVKDIHKLFTKNRDRQGENGFMYLFIIIIIIIIIGGNRLLSTFVLTFTLCFILDFCYFCNPLHVTTLIMCNLGQGLQFDYYYRGHSNKIDQSDYRARTMNSNNEF